MANKGRFIDRSPDLRVAGISSYKDPNFNAGVKDCLPSLDTDEQAENLIRAHCRRSKPKPTGKRSPRIPGNSIGELLSFELNKSLMTLLQEKCRENLFKKKIGLGEAMETKSKPDDVTNLSRTFGDANPQEGALYDLLMPRKTAEQVNREYAEFHQKHIVSHNHYFPAEQINRGYNKEFNRFRAFGIPSNSDRSGIKMKNCLKEGEEHLLIVKKPVVDLEDRTKAPLGKKFAWYPYVIPENITFGLVKRNEVDMRSLLENTWPSEKSEKLSEAISHMNTLRDFLQRQDDITINHILTVLRNKDKESTGLLPLPEIITLLRKMHIPADSDKIRTATSHYQLIVDEGCCSEAVKYEDLVQLLSILVPLPLVGSISPLPDAVYNKDTTYRLLCADLGKEPNKDRNMSFPHKSAVQKDMDNTHVNDIINPDISTLRGLWPSDFKQPRSREEVGRIFCDILPKDTFDAMWECLTSEHKDQNNMVSVAQFREEMKKRSLG
ncbi:EF-hand domain-containing family member B-like [Drosophila bipectinata]|uniref:EF-hand domain-containing family member B-like n=1 Tax=Drosophila bipectinata TaxID=42026 RepID=UPI001C8A342E|nr:uncharacterized protein LOC108120678 [Drosophila bipectinata]